MKIAAVKRLSVVVCILAALFAVFITRTVIHGSESESRIILYHNDRSWSRSDMPAQVNEKGVYYAPLTFFVQLQSVNVRINDTLQTFIITRGDKYLSFDIITDYAANQDKIRIPLATYEYNGEHYAPVEAVCFFLDLNYEAEVSPLTGEVALRVTDGREQYSFQTLLRRRHPGFLEEENTDGSVYDVPVHTTLPESDSMRPETTEDDTTEAEITTAPPELTDRIIYISIEDSPDDYTDEILEVLDEFGYKATFFVVGDKIADSAPTLMRILSKGHGIALHSMEHSIRNLKTPEAVIADIEAENDILERTVKLRTRMWSPPGTVSDEIREYLAENGYIIWDSNVSVPTQTTSVANASWYAINGIWNNDICALRFPESPNTAQVLRNVLEFIESNSDVCELRTASPAFAP